MTTIHHPGLSVAFGIGLALTSLLHRASAGNAACWGDDERQDISCRALTETFLLGMRHASRDELVKAMGVKGRQGSNNVLHFASNYSKGQREGSGDVNFTFDPSGYVSVIYAIVDKGGDNKGKSMEFIWNVDKSWEPFCSDFAGSRNRCDK